MNYKVDSIPFFDKQAKRLSKKYPSLKSDLKSEHQVAFVERWHEFASYSCCKEQRSAEER